MRSSSIAVTAVVATLVATPLVVATPLEVVAQSDLEARFREGMGLLQENRAEEALEVFEGILDEAEEFAPAHYYAGMALGQLQRHDDAFGHFEQAGLLDPGNGDAHRMACITAFYRQDFESAWAQCVLAAQSGVDVAQAFVELAQVSDRPAELDAWLAAPRVFVLDVDLGGLGARDAEAGRNSAASSDIARSAADFVEIRKQISSALQQSSRFAIVKQQDLAAYLAVLEIDVFENDAVEGNLKLLDATTGDTAYSRRTRFRTIDQPGEVQRVVRREIEYLENWLAEQ